MADPRSAAILRNCQVLVFDRDAYMSFMLEYAPIALRASFAL